MNSSNRPSASLRWLLLAQLCLLLNAPFASAQTAPAASAADQDPKARKVPVEENKDANTPADKDVVTLSPFEVVADTKGYYNANTMSGTRFNSKIEDLASSITVMTKAQMDDFSIVDINDAF